MRQPKLTLSANDNVPIRRGRTNNTVHQSNLNPTNFSAQLKPKNKIDAYKRKMTLAWAMPLLAAIMAGYAFMQNASLTALIWPSAVIGVLLLWTAKRAEPHTRLRNVSTLMAIGAITVALAGLLAFNGFTLMGVELALLVSILSLFASWALDSRPAVMLSTVTAIVYLASLFPELGLLTGLTEGHSQIGIGLIPGLLLGQATLALHLRSQFITALIIIAGYLWVIYFAKALPPHALAGLGFTLAAAHYCLGKAWDAANIFGARLHTSFALIIALAAALYVQSLWMKFEPSQAQPLWVPNNFWWSAFALSIFTIFVSCLMRYKSSQITLPGIFIISLGALLLPIATAKPVLIHSAFSQIPGLEAFPGLGLVIGATLIASCLYWIASGLKNGQLLNVVIGVIAIGIEAIILYQPKYFNMDFGVVFVMSLICALCIGGLIAGSSSTHPEHSRSYA